MVIAQYPHYIYVLETGQSRQKDNGDWVPGESSWKEYGPAREETNGKGSVMRSEDYQDIVTSATIFCPLTCKQIEEGTTIIVTTARILPDATEEQIANLQRTGVVLVKGSVKKFDRSAMHCRIWL